MKFIRDAQQSQSRCLTQSRSNPASHRMIAAFLSTAGLCASLTPIFLSQSASAQLAHPGAEPAKPDPGQPGFASPEPNAGEKPRTGDEPSKLSQMAVSEAPANTDPEQPSFLVSDVVIKYLMEHPQLPAIDDLLQREVHLAWRDGGYVEWTPGEEDEAWVLLADIPLKPASKYSSRALLAISRAIVDELNSRGIIGVTVSPSDIEFAPPAEGDPAWGKDLRRDKKNALTLLVRVGIVTEMRTIALGSRIPSTERINNPVHKRIIEQAPIQIYHEDDAERQDLLRRDLIEDYVYHLNRHPGRRVDIAVSAAQQQGGIALDLLVNENQPWLAYLQASNTGTKSTSEWRERFGYVHNQLTNRDDILSLDYVTAGFTDSHALTASYDTPIYGEWLRMKAYVGYNQYSASDVGFAGEKFEGQGFKIGAELVANIFQQRETFIDAVVGVRYENIEVDNQVVDVKGDDSFFLPYLGLRLERNTDIAATNASLNLEFNLPDVAGTTKETLNELGRINPDDGWVTLQWDFSHSFYLEPLLFRDQWSDPQSSMATLAHEVAVAVRGQYAFDYRLVPNFEQVVGGLYTVRGYDESVVAGDSAIVGSLEYRFHLPQALGIEPEAGELFGSTFRFKPQQPYGRADWDLILKAFLDVGRAVNTSRESFERDHTLIGTGVGFEFAFKRNFSMRLDWGFALEDVKGETEAGDNRLHFVGTILF